MLPCSVVDIAHNPRGQIQVITKTIILVCHTEVEQRTGHIRNEKWILRGKKKNVFQKHIEQFGLERTLKIIQFQSSAMSRNLSLHQGAQSPIQTSLEHYQGCSTQFLWAIYSSVSEFPPSIYLTHAPFSWEPYPFVLSLHASVKCPSPFQACTLAPA